MKLLILVSLLGLALSAKKTFFGDQVLILHPENDIQVEVIKENAEGLDFWKPDTPDNVRAGASVDVRVPRNMLHAFKVLMYRNRIQFDIKIKDVQALIDNQLSSRSKALLPSSGYSYDTYHSYDEIENWANDIASSNSNVDIELLTKSFEGRNVWKLTIGNNLNNDIILVDCGFHAREWISPAFCQCFVQSLLDDSTGKLDDFTYVVIPVVNPDGYAYTWSDDRMWRKTRSNYGTVCTGVDPNRNCDADWSGPGSSSNACSDTYYGPKLESEVEVKAFADYVRSNANKIKTYITFHSYSQMILYPYSYQYRKADTSAELDSVASAMDAAVESEYGTQYTYGPGAATIYLAAGGSDDFSYDAGVKLVYTVELRDTGEYGFLLPESQISPVCIETINMMETVHSETKTRYG